MAEIVKDADFWKGFIIGLALKPILWRAKEPVAYLYNGVRLPKLPEWDKEAYPYALIQRESGWDLYMLYLSKVPAVAIDLGSDGIPDYISLPAHSLYAEVFSDDEAWSKLSTKTYAEALSTECVWSNYDIRQEDGTLHFAGSEPVPIYEGSVTT